MAKKAKKSTTNTGTFTTLIQFVKLTLFGMAIHKRLKPYMPYIRAYLKSRKDIHAAWREWRGITKRRQ